MKKYLNSEILTAVLVKWAKPMVDNIIADRLGKLEQVQVANEWVKKYFPVAANYSIVNDLSFLAVPATELIIEPRIRNVIEKLGVADADIPEYVSKLVASAIDEAGTKGSISLFDTIEIEKGDLERLRDILERNLPVTVSERYEVKE